MRIILLGANNIVAKNLKKKLFKKNIDLFEFGRNTSINFRSNFKSFKIDLLKRIPFISNFIAINDENIVINFIGETNKNNNLNQINIFCLKKILNQILSKNIKKKIHWIQISSAGVYDRNCKERFINENSSELPSDDYEYSKLTFDNILLAKTKNPNFKVTILRPTSIISKKMKAKYFFQLIKYIKNNIFFFIKDRECVFNFIDIESLSKIIMFSIFKNKKLNNIYIVSNFFYLKELVNYHKKKWSFIPTLPLFFVNFLSKILNTLNIKIIDERKISWLINKKIYSSNKIQKESRVNFKKINELY